MTKIVDVVAIEATSLLVDVVVDEAGPVVVEVGPMGPGGIGEAPIDGQQYARADAAWEVVVGGGGGGSTAWADITGKPSTFPPTLPIAQSGVTNLVTDLAGKAPTTHSHTTAQITGLDAAQSAQDTAIAGKAATVHTHAQADVTNLVTDLAGKAPTVHTHAQADITNLTTDITAAKARANHTGTQLAATISDFNTAADARVALKITNKITVASSAPGSPAVNDVWIDTT